MGEESVPPSAAPGNGPAEAEAACKAAASIQWIAGHAIMLLFERTSMKTVVLIVCVLALALPSMVQAQKPKEPVKVSLVQHDKATDMTKFTTYSWTPGHPSLNPDVDKAIVADIEAQLAARGLTKAAKGDVLVCYHSVEREDVDLSTFDEKPPAAGAERKMAQTVRVGTLVVDLKAGATNKLFWRAKAEGATSTVPVESRTAFLNDVVTKLFALYPGSAPAGKK
jgi:hypothetical protein